MAVVAVRGGKAEREGRSVDRDWPVDFAHRGGASARVPENTLEGFRLAAKVTAYTYGLYVNWLFGRPQGRIKELWA